MSGYEWLTTLVTVCVIMPARRCSSSCKRLVWTSL